jgi:hypothetical protein
MNFLKDRCGRYPHIEPPKQRSFINYCFLKMRFLTYKGDSLKSAQGMGSPVRKETSAELPSSSTPLKI